jgi:hypothetical protein
VNTGSQYQNSEPDQDPDPDIKTIITIALSRLLPEKIRCLMNRPLPRHIRLQ